MYDLKGVRFGGCASAVKWGGGSTDGSYKKRGEVHMGRISTERVSRRV